MENPPLQLEQIELTSSNAPEVETKLSDGTVNKSSDKVDTNEDIIMVDEEADEKVKSPYTVRKTTALGMMDLALLTANANQLRFLITYNTESPTYYVSLSLIIISLILQICVGIALIFKRQMKNTGRDEHVVKTNNLLTVGIFLITVINVFVASFTMIESPKTEVASN